MNFRREKTRINFETFELAFHSNRYFKKYRWWWEQELKERVFHKMFNIRISSTPPRKYGITPHERLSWIKQKL